VPAKPIWPIGVTYGSEHVSRPPGKLAVDDVEFFIDRYSGGPVSLYTLEAARSDVLDALRAHAPAIE
jgi:hypothetical protein